LSNPLFVSDHLQDLTHFHGSAGWDSLKRTSGLIRCDSGQALEHRPELLQHATFSSRICPPCSPHLGGAVGAYPTPVPSDCERKTRDKFFGSFTTVLWI